MTAIDLTPAQLEFLRREIPGFSAHAWEFYLAGYAGSDRRFVRVKTLGPVDGPDSYILIVWNAADHDWDRFLSIISDCSPVLPGLLPHVYRVDHQHGLILEEDLGVQTLKEVLSHTPAHEDCIAMYRRVISQLARWHAFDCRLSATISNREMDEEMLLWETDYFSTHCVTEFCGLEQLLDDEWHKERRRLAQSVAGYPQVCMHRDFQSENIMLHHESIRFIDFQGARLGPAAYDLASLLHDAYCERLTEQDVQECVAWYVSCSGRVIDVEEFRYCAMQRLMQALGAFANLSIHKGKEWYRGFIPVALHRLHAMCVQDQTFPTISRIVARCRELI